MESDQNHLQQQITLLILFGFIPHIVITVPIINGCTEFMKYFALILCPFKWTSSISSCNLQNLEKLTCRVTVYLGKIYHSLTDAYLQFPIFLPLHVYFKNQKLLLRIQTKVNKMRTCEGKRKFVEVQKESKHASMYFHVSLPDIKELICHKLQVTGQVKFYSENKRLNWGEFWENLEESQENEYKSGYDVYFMKISEVNKNENLQQFGVELQESKFQMQI